jgi:hypothetical protein
MKRALCFLTALFACIGLASAQVPMTGAGRSAPTAAGGCAEATAFLARTSGLNGAHQTAYTTMICGLVSDGVWSSLDALYIFATDTAGNAALNLTSSSFGITLTPANFTFTADQGYSAATTSGGLSSNFNPATAPSPQWSQNSAFVGVWRISSSNFAGDAMRQSGGQPINSLFPRFTDGNMYCDVTASSDDGTGVAVPTTGAGFASCSRTASTGYTYYKNGSSLGTRTNTSTAVTSGVFLFLPVLNSGDVAAGVFGAGLNGTQMANLYARLHVYLQTIAGVP